MRDPAHRVCTLRETCDSIPNHNGVPHEARCTDPLFPRRPVDLDPAQGGGAIPILRELAQIKGTSVAVSPPPTSARVADVEIETRTGLLAAYAVEVPSDEKGRNKIVTVRALALSFAPRSGTFTISQEDLDLAMLPAARLTRLTPFRPKGATEKPPTDKESDPPENRKQGKSRTDAKSSKANDGSEPAPVAPPAACALSSLLDLPVLVAGQPFGQVEKLVVEMTSGQLAFVGVGRRDASGQRGDLHWIPWHATSLRVAAAKKPTHAAMLDIKLAKGSAAKAPTSTAGVLTDPLFRKRLYTYFAVEAPEYESR